MHDVVSAGNGSIMRLAAVPMYHYPDLQQAVHLAGQSSRTEHGAVETDEGQSAAPPRPASSSKIVPSQILFCLYLIYYQGYCQDAPAPEDSMSVS
jgi:hypothetical protein